MNTLIYRSLNDIVLCRG